MIATTPLKGQKSKNTWLRTLLILGNILLGLYALLILLFAINPFGLWVLIFIYAYTVYYFLYIPILIVLIADSVLLGKHLLKNWHDKSKSVNLGRIILSVSWICLTIFTIYLSVISFYISLNMIRYRSDNIWDSSKTSVIPSATKSNKNSSSKYDEERSQDLSEIKWDLDIYYRNDNLYPTLAEMNDLEWLKENIPRIRKPIMADPIGRTSEFVASPAAFSYAYMPFALNGTSACDNKSELTLCKHYIVNAILDDNSSISVQGSP